jgi:hypothetical protein
MPQILVSGQSTLSGFLDFLQDFQHQRQAFEAAIDGPGDLFSW